MKRLVDNSEKVIFREEYDPYTKSWGYLAIFPEDEANLGRVACIPFHKDRFNSWVFEPYTEADINYVLSKKIIHKNDPRIPDLVDALENQYDTNVTVVEKIQRR